MRDDKRGMVETTARVAANRPRHKQVVDTTRNRAHETMLVIMLMHAAWPRQNARECMRTSNKLHGRDDVRVGESSVGVFD